MSAEAKVMAACAAEVVALIEPLAVKHDVRVLVATLLTKAAILAAAAQHAGVTRRFILETFFVALDIALDPASATAPRVTYVDNGEEVTKQ